MMLRLVRQCERVCACERECAFACVSACMGVCVSDWVCIFMYVLCVLSYTCEGDMCVGLRVYSV